MLNIKLSFLLKMKIKPFLLGAFLSRIMLIELDGKQYFYAYSSYKTSKFIYHDEFDFLNYPNILIDKFNILGGFSNWIIHRVSDSKAEIRFYVENDLNLSINMLYKALYQKLMSSEWILNEELTQEKKDFIRGFVEIRGSVDTTAKLIAQDYFFNSKIEIKKAQILTDMMNLPIRFANFNPRNLQPQYVSGENRRNTQFRIHAFYYAKNIGFLNDYKAKIFETVYYHRSKRIENLATYFDLDLPESKNDDVSFIKYLNFFTNNIYDKELTPEAIRELRMSLGFDTNESTSAGRNASIVELYRTISEDKCAICGTTQTFENKKTGKQHFEIHHMISYFNGKEYDNIANLVKLCPTCHDSLKRNRTSKTNQIKSILKILHERSEIYEFTSSYLGIDDINDLSDKIWSMLG